MPAPDLVGAARQPRSQRIYTVPHGTPFLPAVAGALLSGNLPVAGGPRPRPLELAGITLLLPTRRDIDALTAQALRVLSDPAAFRSPGQAGAALIDEKYSLAKALPQICSYTDQGSAALVKDLKQRGLLDQTMVMWSGEFGRLPISQKGTGRDHNRFGFSLWMAGGGFKRGYLHGSTD